MLNWLVLHSLRFRGIVIALAVAVIAYGSWVAARAKLDVFPEFAPPMVVIQTEAPGLSPEQVELLVTRPLELALNGAPQLATLRSESIQGLSAITITFEERADIFRVRQLVAERLSEVAGQLPAGVKAPRMGPLTSSTSHTLNVGLTSTNRTPMELRTFADWTMRPRLLAVPGVARVDVFGGEVRQLQIEVQPDKLLVLGVTLDDVLGAARKALAIHGTGFIENRNQRVVIRTEGAAVTPEQLGEIVVSWNKGVAVRLRDVAEVRDGAEPKFGDAQINGVSGIIIAVHSAYGANTLDVTAGLEEALREFQPLLQAERIEVHPRLFRPATFVERSLQHISRALLLGGVLVLVVLWVFLLDWRTALISFVSIPLSLLTAVVVLDYLGVSLNTITLSGFAIAIGVVVDDAIIDVENILRRLRENVRRAAPRPVWRVVLEASLEVRHAIVYATFIVALVFVPVLTMGGIAGRLFSPLALSFLIATMASLFVALTVTPALCVALLSRAQPHEEPRYLARVKAWHRALLTRVSGAPRFTMGLVSLLVLAACATIPFFGGEFLPEFREGHLVIHIAAVPGSSLEHSVEMGKRVTAELLKDKRIVSIGHQAGRAEIGEDTFGPNYGEMHTELAEMGGEEAEQFMGTIREYLAQFPGLSFKVMPFLVERMEETLSGATAEVVVKLQGQDLDALDRAAATVQHVMQNVRGAADVSVESQPGAPELVVRLHPERLSAFGLASETALEAIEAAFQGVEVGQVFNAQRVSDVTVVLPRARRADPEHIGSLMLASRAGGRVPLREVADVFLAESRSAIVHEAAQRRQQVTCNVVGRDTASFLAELKKRIAAEAKLPPGIYPVFAGSAEAQRGARRELLVHSSIAALGILLLLAIVFRSPRNLLLVLANLPFALVGGVLAVFAGGGSLSVGSLIGFVTLFGISMRNSIMMMSHFEHLVREEGCAWNLDTALRGASERLVPVLMTALVTGLGLLPMALGAESAGGEIEGPMALVILGGLITSTILNLLVLPVLAVRFANVTARGELLAEG
ncbi:MAG TPA: efflux RND transporter permease subunit [Opitutaceae bacterium]|nr:efflux RND transporter permease subunit [Opitutaceae bacterium]